MILVYAQFNSYDSVCYALALHVSPLYSAMCRFEGPNTAVQISDHGPAPVAGSVSLARSRRRAVGRSVGRRSTAIAASLSLQAPPMVRPLQLVPLLAALHATAAAASSSSGGGGGSGGGARTERDPCVVCFLNRLKCKRANSFEHANESEFSRAQAKRVIL